MTAIGEEAVVGKTSHVVEEVVVSKTANERVEQIDDTVRRTDVEVDDHSGADGSSLRDRLPGSVSDDSTAASRGSSLGDKGAGLGKEALGNAKQGLGGLTGNDSLKREGMELERTGEIQQSKRPDTDR